MVIVLLLFGSFSTTCQVQWEEYGSLGHAIDGAIHGDPSRLSCSPLFDHDSGHVVELQRGKMEVRSIKHMSAGFDDTDHREARKPGVPPCERG